MTRRRARAGQALIHFAPPLPADLQAVAMMPDELARLEAWGEARGYEVTYTNEDGNRLSMARPGGAPRHAGA